MVLSPQLNASVLHHQDPSYLDKLYKSHCLADEDYGGDYRVAQVDVENLQLT